MIWPKISPQLELEQPSPELETLPIPAAAASMREQISRHGLWALASRPAVENGRLDLSSLAFMPCSRLLGGVVMHSIVATLLFRHTLG